MLDGDLRQDLYRYAAKVIGTAGSWENEQARARRMIDWGDRLRTRGSRWSLFDHFRRREARDEREKSPEAAARYAIRSIRKVTPQLHAEILSLVDALVAIGSEKRVSSSLDSAPLRSARSHSLI